ncbi:DUF4168 domain-containing protein [Pontibacter sp. MBLB2868]|uniref:DUF4168 domain-containing protein n=1 Tax=Pontibacter sp. MBLB2868 TaxID=3451555 RepID=UPI003F74E204
MKIAYKLKGTAITALILIALALGTTATAQQTSQPAQQQQAPQNFTDKELKQFADASNRLMEIQRKGEEKMLKILEEEKLSVDKFNEMAQAHQQEKLDEVVATEQEKTAFNKAAERMMAMQPALQKEVEAAIQKEGMQLDRYEQIMVAYRQDPVLQEKLNKMMAQQ